jgi:Cu2+-exporting ATPase
LAPLAARQLRAHPGEGIAGACGGDAAAMGSAEFMARLGWRTPLPLQTGEDDSRTAVFVGWSGAVRGLLLLEDPPLAEARDVVAALRRRGIASALVSGDRPAAVRRLAEASGIETWQGGLAPLDKVRFLQAWSRAQGPAAMVGDGLNDGPVLAAASVGITVSGATDLASETAEVRLPEGHLDALPWLIDHARQVRRRILANILWALGYNGIALTLAVCGLLQPVLAAGLMAGSSLLVVANSLLVGQMKSIGEAA